ncbi:hypothetical protein L1049_021851 [Liquidambar formosana]|uniref:Disease resistance protein n=1 Tax=Liquidambar formosana TaxID=63359 RepID=A0AAP0RBJ1_LIQFO
MAVEAVVSVVIEKLADLLIAEAKLLSEVKDQVEWIKDELRAMICFLRDADDKQGGDARVENWKAEIRDVAYDAEDIIDALILRKEQKKNEKTVKRLAAEVGADIKRIRTKLAEISERRSTYGIENLAVVGEASSYTVKRLRGDRGRRRSSPYSDESDVIGVEEDLKSLASRLVENEAKRRVVSIVGMGGLGKTTLAKKVYNSNMSPIVSNVVAKGLLEDIWRKVMGNSEDNLAIEQMEEKLSSYLEEKRYLVVMDDVWDIDAWNSVKAAISSLGKWKQSVANNSQQRSGPAS